MSSPANLTIRRHDAADWPNIRQAWEEIHSRTPNATIFSSAEWVDAWLSTVGQDVTSSFLVAKDQDRTFGICLLTSSMVPRGPFLIKTLWFGTAGEPDEDSVYVEFGDILCLEGYEPAFAGLFSQHLRQRQWDELVFPRMNCSPALDSMANALSDAACEATDLPSPYLDLDELRNQGLPFEETLPRKLRQQIRQSFRIYAEAGPVHSEVATSAEEALAFLDELGQLHEASWIQRGYPRGAFGSPRFRDFHRKLINGTFDCGWVQMAKILAGKEVIGLIYNLVGKGTAYFYQSGLAYHVNSRVKPGFVCQVVCINHSKDIGLKKYDFMGGDTAYKRELGTYSGTLRTLVIRKKSLRMRLIEAMRTASRRLRGLGGRGRSPETPASLG